MHGAIDGFSRTIPYISSSTNNLATTVIQLFLDGVSRLDCQTEFALIMVVKMLKYGNTCFNLTITIPNVCWQVAPPIMNGLKYSGEMSIGLCVILQTHFTT